MKNLSKILVYALLVSVLYVISMQIRQQYYPSSLPKISPTESILTQYSYQSESLKFSISVPAQFHIQDNNTTVLLNSSNETITIGRNGTNFTTLNEYVEWITEKNNLKTVEEENIQIANLTSKRITVKNDNTIKHIYYIFRPDWIYTLSTDSPELFDDLDTIAQSFRATP